MKRKQTFNDKLIYQIGSRQAKIENIKSVSQNCQTNYMQMMINLIGLWRRVGVHAHIKARATTIPNNIGNLEVNTINFMLEKQLKRKRFIDGNDRMKNGFYYRSQSKKNDLNSKYFLIENISEFVIHSKSNSSYWSSF